MTRRSIIVGFCTGMTLPLLVACAAKPPPPPPNPEAAESEPTTTATPQPPVVDASANVPEDAAPAAPPGKSFALCSVPTDPSKAQCLTWTGCAGGIVQTYAGNPIRKCSASADACEAAEKKLADEIEKLKGDAAGAPRVCKLRNYLKKEIRIEGATVFVCPEDADDRPLSELWRQLASTCKEPIAP